MDQEDLKAQIREEHSKKVAALVTVTENKNIENSPSKDLLRAADNVMRQTKTSRAIGRMMYRERTKGGIRKRIKGVEYMKWLEYVRASLTEAFKDMDTLLDLLQIPKTLEAWVEQQRGTEERKGNSTAKKSPLIVSGKKLEACETNLSNTQIKYRQLHNKYVGIQNSLKAQLEACETSVRNKETEYRQLDNKYVGMQNSLKEELATCKNQLDTWRTIKPVWMHNQDFLQILAISKILESDADYNDDIFVNQMYEKYGDRFLEYIKKMQEE